MPDGLRIWTEEVCVGGPTEMVVDFGFLRSATRVVCRESVSTLAKSKSSPCTSKLLESAGDHSLRLRVLFERATKTAVIGFTEDAPVAEWARPLREVLVSMMSPVLLREISLGAPWLATRGSRRALPMLEASDFSSFGCYERSIFKAKSWVFYREHVLLYSNDGSPRHPPRDAVPIITKCDATVMLAAFVSITSFIHSRRRTQRPWRRNRLAATLPHLRGTSLGSSVMHADRGPKKGTGHARHPLRLPPSFHLGVGPIICIQFPIAWLASERPVGPALWLSMAGSEFAGI